MSAEPARASEWAGRIAWIIRTYHEGNATAAARRAGVAPQVLTRVMRGEGSPSAETLAAILRAYPRVSADWLVCGRGPRERAPDSGLAAVRELVDAVQAVLDDARRRLGG